MYDCPLCNIPTAEKVIYSDPVLYIAQTKTMKGHKVRVMVVINRHSKSPTFEELSCAYYLIFQYMKNKLEGKRWILYDNTYATISSHWHLVASDEYSSDPNEVEAMRKTPKVMFPREAIF